MKRSYADRSDPMSSQSQGEQGFWPSYADMMSAVALILFFLMLLSYVQNLITGNDLQNTQEVLEDTKTRLELTMAQVDKAEDELETISIALQDAKDTLAQQENEIAKQQSLISKQKDYISAADEELTQVRSQMQTIAVLRLSILEQIRDSIVDVMGDATKVSIGENGSIILSEAVLFNFGMAEIKPESQPVLEQLAKVFRDFLSNGENAKYVDSIVISGHTDSVGLAIDNRALSTDRANSVLNYLLSQNNAALEPYAQYFCAAGYGATRPVASNDTEQGRATNRRIEISMILKDETVLEIVEDYLALELPGETETEKPDADEEMSSVNHEKPDEGKKT